jgi:diacylglycerol kinase
MRPLEQHPFRHRSILPRFADAFRGIYTAYREEPNLRFHVFAASGCVVAGLAVGLERWEAAYLAFTIAAVLVAEMVNTAVERAVDLAAGGRLHPLAGQAKQVAAGAVLLAAGHALFAALLLFAWNRGPLETLAALVRQASVRPWLLLLPGMTGLLGLFGGKER